MDSSMMIDQPQALTLTNDHNQDQTATDEQCAHEPMLVDSKDECAHEPVLVDAKDECAHEPMLVDAKDESAHDEYAYEPMLVVAKDQCAHEPMLIDEDTVHASLIDKLKALTITSDHEQEITVYSSLIDQLKALTLSSGNDQDEDNITTSLIDKLKALSLTSNHNQARDAVYSSLVDQLKALTLTGDDAQIRNRASNKAAQVFATTELMEMILLNAAHRPLRSTLQQVSHRFRDTIRGSPRIQRYLHNRPDWKRTTICPAPIRASMLNYVEFVQNIAGNFLYHCEPEVPDNHVFVMRFNRDAVKWACNKDRTANITFRNMLVCQPPPVAVEIFCWTMDKDNPQNLKNIKRRIQNSDGIRVGELFDLVKASAPIGGNVRMTYTFRRDAARSFTTLTTKAEDQWLLELRAIARESSHFP